jgi:hypothetical protein
MAQEWFAKALRLLQDGTFWTALGSIATAIALFLLLAQWRDQVASGERAQASLVSAWVTNINEPGFGTRAVLNNAGTEPVYRVIVWLVSVTGNGPPDGKAAAVGQVQPFTLSILPPGQFPTRLPEFHYGAHSRAGLEISFTDAANRHWVRQPNGQLVQINAPGAEYYGISPHLQVWELPAP